MAKPTKATLAERAKAVGLDIDLNDTVDQLVAQVEAAEAAAASAPPAPPAPQPPASEDDDDDDVEEDDDDDDVEEDDDEEPLAPYTVAAGKSVSCLAGVVGPGEAIELKDLNKDAVKAATCLKGLIKRKLVKKN